MVAALVDIEVNQGWRCQGDELVQQTEDAEGQEFSRVAFDQAALLEYIKDLLAGQEDGDPPWRVAHVIPFPSAGPTAHNHVVFDGHMLRLVDSPKFDARDFVRAVCSCGDYTSSPDSPNGATRAWLAHWVAKTRGIPRGTRDKIGP